MTLEQKASDYSKGFWREKEAAEEDFTAGYTECISDLEEFIRVNPKATVKQITEYLKTL